VTVSIFPLFPNQDPYPFHLYSRTRSSPQSRIPNFYSKISFRNPFTSSGESNITYRISGNPKHPNPTQGCFDYSSAAENTVKGWRFALPMHQSQIYRNLLWRRRKRNASYLPMKTDTGTTQANLKVLYTPFCNWFIFLSRRLMLKTLGRTECKVGKKPRYSPQTNRNTGNIDWEFAVRVRVVSSKLI
jgi:hypothetical protein